MKKKQVASYTCIHLIMLVQILDSSEINSPHNNDILSRCTAVESDLTSVTCLCHSIYMIVSLMAVVIKHQYMPELLNRAMILLI